MNVIYYSRFIFFILHPVAIVCFKVGFMYVPIPRCCSIDMPGTICSVVLLQGPRRNSRWYSLFWQHWEMKMLLEGFRLDRKGVRITKLILRYLAVSFKANLWLLLYLLLHYVLYSREIQTCPRKVCYICANGKIITHYPKLALTA